MPVNPIPDNYPQVIPYLAVDGAAAAIDFYVSVFGGKERERMSGPDGQVYHAEVEIGRGLIMLSDAFPEMGGVAPPALGGSPVTVMVYVENSDETFQRAIDAGATADRPVENQFYGDRSGQFTHPWGHKWYVSTHIEDVEPDEMERRAAAAMQQG